MASEQFYVTTPLKREAAVQLENLHDDIWEATVVYAKKAYLVGKFQGKDHAIEGARKRAEQVADIPAQTGQRIARKHRKKNPNETLNR
jgi:hypothetical protein